MANSGTTGTKLTRGDKAHNKFMDKLIACKDGMKHGMDSITTIHKQTMDGTSQYAETISKSQESERVALYDIVKTCKDETKCQEAYARLREPDRIKDEEIKHYNDFAKSEREIANRNITGLTIGLLFAGGLITTKQGRQMAGKVFKTIGNNFPRLKG